MNKTLALCLTLFASPLAAHPHIFVNTGLSFVLDGENRLTHVQVTWEYDELYSLLVTEDMGVDSDYDGVLNAEDIAVLMVIRKSGSEWCQLNWPNIPRPNQDNEEVQPLPISFEPGST